MRNRVRSFGAGTVLAILASGAVALVLAGSTLLRGVAFWDTGELQVVAPLLGTAHPTGFPTYVVIGWIASVVLQPFGEPALRMNLLSAVCLAAAAGLTALLVSRLTGRASLALAAGILLATTPIAWAIGTHADAHALHLALLALLLVVLVGWERARRAGEPTADRRLVGAAVVCAIALGNHSLVLLLAPGIALYVLAVEPGIVRRPRLVGACLVALAATLFLVYLELPLRAGPFRAPLVYGHPETWDGLWTIILAEQFRGSLVAPFSDLGPKLAELVWFAGVQLGPLVALVPLGFVATAWRQPRYALLTAPAVVITCWFAASYANAQIDRYYLGPVLIVLTWIAVLGGVVVDGLLRLVAWRPTANRAGNVARASEPPGGRAASALSAVLAAALVLPTVAALPKRHAALDLSRERQAVEWLDAVLDERIAPQGAVIVSWWSYSTPLWYAQDIQGRRPDVTIVDDRTRLDQHLGEISDVIDANLGRRPVLVIQTDPAVLGALARRYLLVRLDTPGFQPVYRVDATLAAGGR